MGAVPRWALLLAVPAAVLVAVGVVLAAHRDQPTAASDPSLPLTDLAVANQALAARAATLRPTADPAPLEPVLAQARRALAQTRARLAAVPPADRWMVADVRTALAAQARFLDQVAGALADPPVADARTAQKAAVAMTTAYTRAEGLASVPAPRSGPLLALVDARIGTSARLDGRRLVAAVDPILAEARRGRLLLGRIHAGGTGTLDAVVANRRSVLAKAEALPQGGDARLVRDRLVRAVRATLAADIAMRDGHDADEASTEATRLKRQFVVAYNAVRARVGAPLVGDDW